MTSRRSLFAALLAGAVLVALPAAAQAQRFAVGQVWELKEGSYPGAQVVIGRLERLGGAPVVHVSVIGVRTNAESEPGEAINIGHMPFAEDAARRSVGRRLATGGRPDENFELGYAQWRSGQGGVFTITISQAVALALGMMSAPPQPAVTASR